jgi:hypothetical protein
MGQAWTETTPAQHHLSGYGTADVLFDYTRRVMPADRPGRMQEVEYWAVLAYLLKPMASCRRALPWRRHRPADPA